MKCLFVPPLDLCPQDIGVEVKNYFPLSGVDTIVTSNQKQTETNIKKRPVVHGKV